MRTRLPHQQIGFSLLGVLVAAVLAAILSALAIPSYQSQLAKTRRHTGQSALLVLAQHMQRVYTDRGSYTPDGDPPDLPLDIAQIRDAQLYYSLALTDATSQSFVLRATPRGRQAADGILELTNTGQRRWDADNNGSITNQERHW